MPLQRILIAFVAGFVAVLTVHQGVIWLGTQAGLLQGTPWNMRPVPPFGVPTVLSGAFFGGLWGILLAAVLPRFGRGAIGWLLVFLVGGFALSAVGWFVVAPLKGRPAGFPPLDGMARGITINGSWALATAAILRFVGRG